MRCGVSIRTLQSCFLLLLLLSGLSHQCGPGRGSGRRRRPRKLTPFVFKQHVPNVSENTLGASGLSEGPIKRNSPKFKDLVKNTNPEIEFRDEEGTGADYMMSQRCRDKLDRLAISVMNQWGKGVKLRVTEAWDEDNHHAADSLHYEGRAVDITTSDRDKSKYGMLARLAVEAGFDWVYYESRGHIHCSVKSDSSVATKIGGCFPGSGTVVLEGGAPVPMSTLAIGDRVLSLDDHGRFVFSEVITFMDRNEKEDAEFRVITTEDGDSVTLTPKHLTYVTDSNVTTPGETEVISSWRTEFAESVAPGQFLLKVAEDQNDLDLSGSPRWSRVVSTRTLTLRGVYAPLTTTGTIVVDGHVVSCYAFINSVRVAHLAFAPMRLLHEWSPGLSALLFSTGSASSETPPTGLHWYARLLYDIGRVLLSRSVLHVP